MNTYRVYWNFWKDFLKAIIISGIYFLIILLLHPYVDAISASFLVLMISAFMAYLANGYFWPFLSYIVCHSLYVYYIIDYPGRFQMDHHVNTIYHVLTVIVNISVICFVKHNKNDSLQNEIQRKMLPLFNKFLNQLLTVDDRKDICNIVCTYSVEVLNCSSVFYVVDDQKRIDSSLKSILTIDPLHEEIINDDYELAVANECVKRKEKIGRYTKNYSNANLIYIPFVYDDIVYGVLGLYIKNRKNIRLFAIEYGVLFQKPIVITLQCYNFKEKNQRIQIQNEKEKLRSSLLHSISHDFRTPLTSIIGITDCLLERDKDLSKEDKLMMVADIHHQTIWLYRLVENILTITKMMSRENEVKKTLEYIEELISEVLDNVRRYHKRILFEVSVPKDPVSVWVNAVLIEQVMINLIENSIHHGKATEILLQVKNMQDDVIVSVIDNGIGIDEDIIKQTLNESQFVLSDKPNFKSGLGLGLQICNTIIIDHRGELQAKNNKTGGATFTFNLKTMKEGSIINGENKYSVD